MDQLGGVFFAALAVVVSLILRRQRRHLSLLVTLGLAALLVPAEQARLHTLVSLDKHADMGT